MKSKIGKKGKKKYLKIVVPLLLIIVTTTYISLFAPVIDKSTIAAKGVKVRKTQQNVRLHETSKPASALPNSETKKVNLAQAIKQQDLPVSRGVSQLKQKITPLTTTPNNTVNNSKVEKSDLFGQDLNSYVLRVIKTYELGKYPYLLNTDYENYNGVTSNIIYQGSTIAKAHPSGNRATHCVGITFEVFFKAMQERNKKLGLSHDDFNGMKAEELHNFMLNWFVSDGVKPQQNCAMAVEKYGIGNRIHNFEEAKAGDFIDISRENNTGHTAVFLNWIRKDGKIAGFKYWGSQSSSNGIAYKEEYFNVTDSNGYKLGNVMIDQVYIARVGAVKDYRSFK